MGVDRPGENLSWAEDPQSLISEPVGERARGWPFQYVPPADQKNWLQRAVGRWIEHLGQTGSSFKSLHDAADDLAIGGSATVRLDVDNQPFFRPLVDGLQSPENTAFGATQPAVDGQRAYTIVIDAVASTTAVVATRFDGAELTTVAQTDAVGDLYNLVRSDGRSVAAQRLEINGAPTGRSFVDIFDPVSLELRQTIGFDGITDEFVDLICIGSHVVIAAIDPSSGNIRIDGYETDTDTLDWSLNLPATGVISGGDFAAFPGSLASNGETISLFVSDGDDRFVFFFNADGTSPDGSLSTDWPNVLAYAEILPADVGITPFGRTIWIGSTCYVGTDSAIGAGALSAVQLRAQFDPSVYLGELDAEVIWRGASLDSGDFVSSLTTDGDRLYLALTDAATAEKVVFVALDSTRREQRDVVGIADPVQFVVEDYILEIDDPDQDSVDAIACDGMYLWCVRGTLDGDGRNRIDLLSTTRQARRFHRVDGGARFRQPFHGLLIPE